MSTTEKQRQAAIENGRKSRGPVSDEGKQRSRQNALKHGLSGDGTVLTPELQAALQREIAGFTASIEPRDYVESRYVEQAALASIRKTYLLQADLANGFLRGRNARRKCDESHEFEVRAHARLFAKDPIGAVNLLKRTSDGCDFLIQAWDELRLVLDREGTLNADQAQRAWLLVGWQRRPPSPGDSPRLERFYQALDAMRARDPHQAASPGQNPATPHASTTFSAAQAKQIVLEFIDEEQAALEERSERIWDEFDGPDREDAAIRAFFDPSREAAQRARYINDADRHLRRAFDDLRRHRREVEEAGLKIPATPPAPPEPEPEPEPEPKTPQHETTEPAESSAPEPQPRRVRFVDRAALAELMEASPPWRSEPINDPAFDPPDPGQ